VEIVVGAIALCAMFSSILHGKDYLNVNLEKYCSRSSNSLERISFMRECMSVMNLRDQRSLDQPPSGQSVQISTTLRFRFACWNFQYKTRCMTM
jgi:hypothetical protein